ncbi:hypothetical protein ACFQWB_05245 [Paenibacillus thermoaerophilus]|uniref:Uncharacterized protein n=1 Tax=Paenibacillus thermoaerophilus TaxID=1215385 RepID=A0ABW2V3A0_9BACL|nr:hypothetical protein [Paenibacillus thermoaerophilus]TMV14327.1 hypothetical protein FE781_10400 [Paenibacillus thermoaerophilus]
MKSRVLLILVTLIIISIGTFYLFYMQYQPDGKVRGAESLRNADRNVKIKQIFSQISDPDLFSYGAEIYVKMENQESSSLQFEEEPMFEIKKLYRDEGEFPDLTATKLPPGSKIYKVVDSPNLTLLAVYINDHYVLYKKY